MSERPTFRRERELMALGYLRIVGVDEAGRGPLAGPVVAAAAIVPHDFASPHFEFLHDSKQMSADLRELVFADLCGTVEHGVGMVHAAEIDRINIRQASWRAMKLAVADLKRKAPQGTGSPDFVLIDGLPYGRGPWPYEAIVSGDALSLSIAAASVIAKVTRDRLMVRHDARYPGYGFARHKGYGSPEHLRTLQELGPCALHRKSYAPVRRLLPGYGQELTLPIE